MVCGFPISGVFTGAGFFWPRLLRKIKNRIPDFERLLGSQRDRTGDFLSFEESAVFRSQILQHEAFRFAKQTAMFAGSFLVLNDDVAVEVAADDNFLLASKPGFNGSIFPGVMRDGGAGTWRDFPAHDGAS
jgi:hypothetical protein